MRRIIFWYRNLKNKFRYHFSPNTVRPILPFRKLYNFLKGGSCFPVNNLLAYAKAIEQPVLAPPRQGISAAGCLLLMRSSVEEAGTVPTPPKYSKEGWGGKSFKLSPEVIFSSLVLTLCCCAIVHAEVRIGEETKDVCNKAILSIYKEILQSKNKYQELSGFGEDVLLENKYGIYTISYQYKDPRLKKDSSPYEFLITIVGMDDKPFHYAGFEDNHYGFPVLGLRISSFIHRDRRFHFFNIDKVIPRSNDILYAHQQQFLPLQVILKSQKNTFKLGERIEFEVEVKNISSKSFRIKGLGKSSLFFTINNKEWGTRPSSSSSDSNEVIIEPSNSLNRTFKGDSFVTPGEVEIFCTYNVAYKGILPYGSLKIRIVE